VDIARRLRYSYSWRATVATPGEWVCGGSSGEWAQHFSNASCYFSNLQELHAINCS